MDCLCRNFAGHDTNGCHRVAHGSGASARRVELVWLWQHERAFESDLALQHGGAGRAAVAPRRDVGDHLHTEVTSVTAYLAAPTILGPVTACNTTVLLDNLVVLPKAQYEILLITPQEVATSFSGDITQARMEIPVGPLKVGTRIQARQHTPNHLPAWTPVNLAVIVAPAAAGPSDVGYPVLRGHVYDCSYCAVFDGVYPGATVTVYDAHGNVAGWRLASAARRS